jgi:hypothetical protein
MMQAFVCVAVRELGSGDNLLDESRLCELGLLCCSVLEDLNAEKGEDAVFNCESAWERCPHCGPRTVTINEDYHIRVHEHAGVMDARNKAEKVEFRRQLVEPRLSCLT